MLDRSETAVRVRAHAQRRCRLDERWPTGPNICSRRSTSFTGRPVIPGGEDAEHLRALDQPLAAEGRRRGTGFGYESCRARCRTARRCGLSPSAMRWARRVDGKPVAVPGSDDGMRLHRVVIFAPASHRSHRSCVPRSPSAASTSPLRDHGRIADADGRRHVASRRRRDRRARRLFLIARRQQGRAFGCRLQRLRDHHRDGPGWRKRTRSFCNTSMRNMKGLVLASGSSAKGGRFLRRHHLDDAGGVPWRRRHRAR